MAAAIEVMAAMPVRPVSAGGRVEVGDVIRTETADAGDQGVSGMVIAASASHAIVRTRHGQLVPVACGSCIIIAKGTRDGVPGPG